MKTIVGSIRATETWRTLYHRIADHLIESKEGNQEAMGAREFLISKMNDAVIDLDMPTYAGNDVLLDDLRFGGVGSLRQVWITSNSLRGILSWAQSMAYGFRIDQPRFVAPHEPGMIFAGALPSPSLQTNHPGYWVVTTLLGWSNHPPSAHPLPILCPPG